jgi:hypothetical protein
MNSKMDATTTRCTATRLACRTAASYSPTQTLSGGITKTGFSDSVAIYSAACSEITESSYRPWPIPPSPKMPCLVIQSTVSAWASLVEGSKARRSPGPPAAGVHQRVEALGEFVLVVMRVAIGARSGSRCTFPDLRHLSPPAATEWRVVALHLRLALPSTISCKCCTAISGRR